jgi:hypothetical protein
VVPNLCRPVCFVRRRRKKSPTVLKSLAAPLAVAALQYRADQSTPNSAPVVTWSCSMPGSWYNLLDVPSSRLCACCALWKAAMRSIVYAAAWCNMQVLYDDGEAT